MKTGVGLTLNYSSRQAAGMNPRLRRAVRAHERWRSECLNMIASENVTSPAVRRLFQSDMEHRYSSPMRYYRGTRYIDEAKRITEELACEVFGAEYANVGLISGHLSDVMALSAFAKPGDAIITTDPVNGGYPGLSREGFPKILGLKVHYWPYNKSEMNIQVEQARASIENLKPRIVFFGASFIPFPHPVKELANIVHDAGAIVVFDGSHVLGLIAGKQFQDPLREGADILVGSTHKSFPGPQGGILLTNRALGARMEDLNAQHAIVDNPHFHRMLALGQALNEMKRFGKEYAEQIVRNSRKLAAALSEHGLPVVAKRLGHTQSHQVILDYDEATAIRVADKLESANIIVDTGVRIGTAEETRRGMKEKQMKTIAGLIASVVQDKTAPELVKKQARKLRSKFRRIHYC